MGALKHAEVGVALLTNPILQDEDKKNSESTSSTTTDVSGKQQLLSSKKPPIGNLPPNVVSRTEIRGSNRATHLASKQQQMQV